MASQVDAPESDVRRRNDIKHRTGQVARDVLLEEPAVVAAGDLLVPLPVTVTTSADRYTQDGWFRRGARNLSFLLRYRLGADPERLARRY